MNFRNRSGENHREDLWMCSTRADPVGRDDAALEWAVGMPTHQSVLALRVGGGREKVTIDTHTHTNKQTLTT